MNVETRREYSQISRWLENLCQHIFQSEGPSVSCAPVKGAHRQGARSIYQLHTGYVDEVLIGIDGIKTRLERSALLIRLAAGISNAAELRGRFFLSERRTTPPEYLQEYRVLVRRGDESLTFSFYLNPEKAQVSIPPGAIVGWRRPLPHLYRLTLLSSTALSRETLQRSVALLAEQCRFGLFDQAGRFFPVSWMDERREEMILEQDVAGVNQFPVKVELGTITISAEALLDLRPGDQIMLPQALPLVGTLRVGSEPWALVRVEEGSSQIVLHVEELLGVEETFRTEPRLLK